MLSAAGSKWYVDMQQGEVETYPCSVPKSLRIHSCWSSLLCGCMPWRKKYMFADMAMWLVLHSGIWMLYGDDTTSRYPEPWSPGHKLAAHCFGRTCAKHHVAKCTNLQPSSAWLAVISTELWGFQKMPSTHTGVHLCCSINFRHSNKLVHHLKHHSPTAT